MLPSVLRTPPSYCQYAGGPCDQDFENVTAARATFLYASQPENIATTVERAISDLRKREPLHRWVSWREFRSTGQMVFCSICKSMRFSDCIIADVTTLNFNLLFEIGFALGLEQPVVPIRDTTIVTDQEQFRELGLLDTVGYVDFQNSDALAEALVARLPVAPIPSPPVALNRDNPLYVLKGHIQTEGDVLLLSTLKKSAVRFRTYDVVETPRLSLHEARKQVEASLALVAHLLSPGRQGAIVHNARCALLAGIAMASGKAVLLVQEGAGHVRADVARRTARRDAPGADRRGRARLRGARLRGGVGRGDRRGGRLHARRVLLELREQGRAAPALGGGGEPAEAGRAGRPAGGEAALGADQRDGVGRAEAEQAAEGRAPRIVGVDSRRVLLVGRPAAAADRVLQQ